MLLLILKLDFWGDSTNRRNFFIEYASASNFDPLVASNWYSKNFLDMQHFKVKF